METIITQPFKNVALLLVEDEIEARDMLSRMLALNYQGLKIYLADDGVSGLEMFNEFRPEIVVTDINMPRMNGIVMSREVKQLEPETTIVAVTAHSETTYLLNAIEIGIDHYVLKPVNYPELFRVLDRIGEKIMLKRLVRQLEEDRARLAAIVESSDDAIIAVDPEGAITSWNAGAERMFGYPADQMKGVHLSFLVAPEKTEEISCLQKGMRRDGQVTHCEVVHVTREGRELYVSLTMSPIKSADGSVVATSCIARDVTERTRMEEIIKHQAQHDTLTDLPNRKLFMDFLALELAQARRNRKSLAVLYMDLDRFKQINDTLGHASGDLLLQVDVLGLEPVFQFIYLPIRSLEFARPFFDPALQFVVSLLKFGSGPYPLGDIEVRDDRAVLPAVTQRRDGHEKPSLLLRTVAGIFHRELLTCAVQHGLDTPQGLRRQGILAGGGSTANITVIGAYSHGR